MRRKTSAAEDESQLGLMFEAATAFVGGLFGATPAEPDGRGHAFA